MGEGDTSSSLTVRILEQTIGVAEHGWGCRGGQLRNWGTTVRAHRVGEYMADGGSRQLGCWSQTVQARVGLGISEQTWGADSYGIGAGRADA
jgi:hypothetical protein